MRLEIVSFDAYINQPISARTQEESPIRLSGPTQKEAQFDNCLKLLVLMHILIGRFQQGPTKKANKIDRANSKEA